MGNRSSRMFQANESANKVSTVITAPIWLPAGLASVAFEKLNPPLSQAIGIHLLGLPDDRPQTREEIRNRIYLTGAYYNNREGADQLYREQEHINQIHQKSMELLEQIVKDSEEKFNEYDLSSLNKIPPEYLCPITLSLMVNPIKVMTKIKDEATKEMINVTHIFEKKAIEGWLLGKSKKTDPLNRQEIIEMKSDDNLKKEIANYIEINAAKKEPEILIPSPGF